MFLISAALSVTAAPQLQLLFPDKCHDCSSLLYRPFCGYDSDSGFGMTFPSKCDLNYYVCKDRNGQKFHRIEEGECPKKPLIDKISFPKS